MTLEQLKKDFMSIAVRYDTKDYLTSSVRKLVFDGVAQLHSNSDGKNYVSVGFYENVQKTRDYTSESWCICRNYELKGFLINLQRFMKNHGYIEIEMTILNYELSVRAYKSVEVNLREDEE